MNLRSLIFSLGISTSLYFAWKFTLFLSLHLIPQLSLSPPLTRYKKTPSSSPPWALVTGASSGIGYGFAQALLLQNFNVILIARSRSSLEDAQRRLEQEFHCSGYGRIRLVVLDASISSAAEVESVLLDSSLTELSITVLVNNVGGLTVPSPHFRPQADYSLPHVDELMNTNMRFTVWATTLLLPTLARNKPSLVLNVGSGASTGIPWLVLYGATKGFIRSFSVGLAREMRVEQTGIDVMYLNVGDTQSKSHVVDVGWKVPSSRQLAEAAVRRAAIAVRIGGVEWCPYWVHGVLLTMLECFPERLIQFALVDEILRKRAELDKGA